MSGPPQLLQSHDFNQLVLARDGYFLYNRNDMYIGRAIEKYGEFSGLEMHLFRQICAPGAFVVEVGANIGAHTIGLARLVGPEGGVWAFEPQRLIFQTLCANVALNSLDNVFCHWAAMGTEQGFVAVPDIDPRAEFNFGGVTLLEGNAGIPVPCLTLDQLNLTKVDFLKIDVEGMEAQVLLGGQQMLKKFKPILYVENDRLEKSEALIGIIGSLGYRMFWHMPPLFNPDNYFANAKNSYPGVVSINMLCLHRDLNINLDGFDEIKDASFHPLRNQTAENCTF